MTKKKRGRPKIELDPKQVETLAGLQLSYDEMGAVLGCSPDTLSRNYADPIKRGRENAKASLKRKQFEVAMKGHVTMLIWLGKQYLGQSDKQETKHEFRGGVVRVPGIPDSAEEWEAVVRRGSVGSGAH